ncbi:hypothetical protein CANARDRAFT_28646 [[Candida] arabinofermentans NRRL YB-2248]|uniref:2-dehydropantolactone reductase n=1 Tax=[Candida] arabinofermentans NRRL YB-2248 TaxID=983967 RepID=A0A1E4SZJ3_9ASCO|nr:hypothetical protein CANARDRAFT_28646 [[Candida] arabinofermentans NRRL YB-2248]
MSIGSISYTLNNGLTIPKIGLGIYKTPPNVAAGIVYSALVTGYRHVDSAEYYENEEDACEGISKWIALDPANNKREDIFYTTKVWDDYHGYEATKKAIEGSLKKAEKIGYIDLILLHSPSSDYEKRHGSWMAFQEFVASGKVKSIGVSNYGIKHLEELLAYPDLKIPPAINQIEVHPWLMRSELCAYCKSKGIMVEAYSPLAKARKFGDPALVALAEKHGKGQGQILIAWSLAKGYIVLPKTVTESRLLPNLDVFEIKLTEEDLALLEKPNEYFTTGWDPTTYPLDSEK